jgi:hypothetical protein
MLIMGMGPEMWPVRGVVKQYTLGERAARGFCVAPLALRHGLRRKE